MKNFLIALALCLSMVSCSFNNQQIINFNLSSNQYSDLGINKVVDLKVFDARKNKDFLGQKKLRDRIINIKSSEDLDGAVRNKIFKDLEQHGFVMVMYDTDLPDKTLEISIESFKYSAKSNFLSGDSEIEMLFKIDIRNTFGGIVYSTTQKLSLDKKHFIMTLKKTDERVINKALQEALDKISTDKRILEILSS